MRFIVIIFDLCLGSWKFGYVVHVLLASLWTYVKIAPTLFSIFIPITIHTSIIPTLMRPDLLGGHPWSPPSMLTYVLLYYSIMYFILWLASFIGNMYYTLVNCKKLNTLRSAGYANYTPMIAFGGILINNTLLLPFIKSILLSSVTPIPYSHHFINGIITAPFVFIGTMFSQRLLNKKVCGIY